MSKPNAARGPFSSSSGPGFCTKLWTQPDQEDGDQEDGDQKDRDQEDGNPQEDIWAVLEVEDTGIGMDPEVAEGLFKPFRQASEGLSREYEGTGIGLAVTKKATEEMGGSIEVDTQKGEGSRFTVRFPAARSAGSAGGPPAGEPQQADQRDLDKPASP